MLKREKLLSALMAMLLILSNTIVELVGTNVTPNTKNYTGFTAPAKVRIK